MEERWDSPRNLPALCAHKSLCTIGSLNYRTSHRPPVGLPQESKTSADSPHRNPAPPPLPHSDSMATHPHHGVDRFFPPARVHSVLRLLGLAVGKIANYPDCVQCRMSLNPLPRSIESSDTEELEEQLQDSLGQDIGTALGSHEDPLLAISNEASGR